jgi:hypothetical protein
VQASLRLRQIPRVFAAIAITLIGGTFGLHETLHESWLQAFYGSVVTAALAGLETIPILQRRAGGLRCCSCSAA